jgi:gamma-glutamyl phosphate reductase
MMAGFGESRQLRGPFLQAILYVYLVENCKWLGGVLGSAHTDCIVTEDMKTAERFLRDIDRYVTSQCGSFQQNTIDIEMWSWMKVTSGTF